MVNLGAKLKNLRIQNSLTQSQVAQRTGVTKSMICSYELGNRQPSYEVLLKLASLYDVTTDYLLGRSALRMLNINQLTDAQIHILEMLIKEFVHEP